MRVAVVGAAGAVGREMWKLLEASSWPEVEPVAYTTSRSQGVQLTFRESRVSCRELSQDTLEPFDLVLASAGAEASRRWTPRFVEEGAVVVDNSSAFRMDPQVPLVVPEINASLLTVKTQVVANPNCSTIQMVVALAPLHRRWGLAAVRVATYQAVSGAGNAAVQEMVEGTRAVLEERPDYARRIPHPIAFNTVPQVGAFEDGINTAEEIKMQEESRRILDLPKLAVSATCVRVPVFRGHSEAVWAQFETPPEPEEARTLLNAQGLQVIDDPAAGAYPLPRRAAGRHEVFVGRIRRDAADSRGLCLWIVSDNLLKGAATNAMQCAEILMARRRASTGAGS